MQPTNRFLRVCHGLPVDRMPVWLMRQAGRYMAAYRELRTHYRILDLIESPELAAQVTLQPIDAFNLDAAIIFSDILPPLRTLGFDLAYIKGEGPLISNPVRSAGDVARLVYDHTAVTESPTHAAIRLLAPQLAARDIPLIGFAGAPFTLAAYAIEGEGGTQRLRLKQFMYEEPAQWDALMMLLARVSGENLRAQAAAGAQVLQLFDSWVGDLSPLDYRTYVLPYTRIAIDMARTSGVPVIHFGTGTAGLLPDMATAGAEVLGVDWRIELATARSLLPAGTLTQGNLDPALLHAPWHVIEPQVRALIDGLGPQPGHVFNLGHGILPGTPVETVARLVDYVHTYSEQYYA